MYDTIYFYVYIKKYYFAYNEIQKKENPILIRK